MSYMVEMSLIERPWTASCPKAARQALLLISLQPCRRIWGRQRARAACHTRSPCLYHACLIRIRSDTRTTHTSPPSHQTATRQMRHPNRGGKLTTEARIVGDGFVTAHPSQPPTLSTRAKAKLKREGVAAKTSFWFVAIHCLQARRRMLRRPIACLSLATLARSKGVVISCSLFPYSPPSVSQQLISGVGCSCASMSAILMCLEKLTHATTWDDYALGFTSYLLVMTYCCFTVCVL